MQHLISKIDRQQLWCWLGILGLCIVFFYFKPDYFPNTLTTVLGLAFIPLIGRKSSKGYKPLYLILAILFFVINTEGRNTLYYFSFIFAALFWFEHTRYKLNLLPVFMLLIIAPIFKMMIFVWSFPIRLEMSALVGQVLNSIGYTVDVVGNVINLNGVEFSVDPACTGLKMMTLTLILSLFVLGFRTKHTNQRFSFFAIVGFLLIGLCLALIANFIRLMTLVIFHILPSNFMHDVIGIIALIVYVLIPLYYISKPFVKRFSFEMEETPLYIKPNGKYRLLLPYLMLIALLIYSGPIVNLPEKNEDQAIQNIRIDGFEKTILSNGVVKLKNEQALVYLKPSVGPVGSTHDPRYCWQGDGYQFSHIREMELNGTMIYAANIANKQSKLYTLWWYDNGQEKTIKEWDWRWKSIGKKEGFRLVNVTAAEEETVLNTAKQLLEKESLF